MELSARENLINSVRKDDAAAFGAFIAPEVLSAVFGRLPLLSLLYLYNAKRIIKRYYSDLVKERPRVKEQAFPEAERLFALKAGKCLRYYVSAEVSPLEMLAILGRKKQLEKLYAAYPNAARYLPMIHKIYFTRLGEGVAVVGNKLILPKEPLSFSDKRNFTILSACFFFVFALIVALSAAAFVSYGTGGKNDFYLARSDGDALSAVKHNYYISLQTDITLSGSVKTYSATFDGGDHVVRLSAPFAEKVTGEIRDVIFVLSEDFTGDAVILQNEGTLKNVRVVAEGVSLSKGGEYMGLLSAVNRGSIEECSAVLDLTVGGVGGGDCYFAPFAGSNEGSVHACLTDGIIHATNVDVAGVVGKNEEAGTVTDCVVKAAFSETSDIKKWTPNVAGVAVQNRGAIYNATVTGSISSHLSCDALTVEEDPASAYAAGIVCVNGGSVKNCQNAAVVTAEARNGSAFAGGIAVSNAHFFAKSDTETIAFPGIVENSQNNGKITSLSSTHSSYAGGIVAHNPQGGAVTDCSVTESVTAACTLEALAEGQTPVSAYAGGFAALNFDLISGGRVTSSVAASADKGYAFAGGFVALNSYLLYQNSYYIGNVKNCLSSAKVAATSLGYNAYAGGIVAENNQGTISACGQKASVNATSSGEKAYEFVGGICGYNYGVIEKSFFIGELDAYDEDSFVGGICGLIRLPFTLRINMAQNAFVAAGHTSGALYLESNYYDLRAGYIYGQSFFDENPSYAIYVTQILDAGAVSSTPEEIVTLEIYYE